MSGGRFRWEACWRHQDAGCVNGAICQEDHSWGPYCGMPSGFSLPLPQKFMICSFFSKLEVQLTRGRSYGQSHCLEVAHYLVDSCNPCLIYPISKLWSIEVVAGLWWRRENNSLHSNETGCRWCRFGSWSNCWMWSTSWWYYTESEGEDTCRFPGRAILCVGGNRRGCPGSWHPKRRFGKCLLSSSNRLIFERNVVGCVDQSTQKGQMKHFSKSWTLTISSLAMGFAGDSLRNPQWPRDICASLRPDRPSREGRDSYFDVLWQTDTHDEEHWKWCWLQIRANWSPTYGRCVAS